MPHILQLNPPLPVCLPNGTPTCPYGGPLNGLAHALIDYGPEHHLCWVVALDQGGEVWTVRNPDIRLQKNFTMGRTV